MKKVIKIILKYLKYIAEIYEIFIVLTNSKLPSMHLPWYSTSPSLQKQNEWFATLLHLPAFTVPLHCSSFSHGSNNCLSTTTP